MSKLRLFLLFLLLILIVWVVVVGIIYYYKPFSNESEIPDQTRKILVIATDTKTLEPMAVDFAVAMNDTIVKTARTRNDSIVEVDIPLNNDVVILYPLDSRYYTDKTINIGGSRFEMELHRVGDILITQNGSLNSTLGEIKLLINTTDSNRAVSTCVRWSNNIICCSSCYGIIG